MHGDVCLQEHYFSERLLQCHQGSAVMKETSSIRGPLSGSIQGRQSFARQDCLQAQSLQLCPTLDNSMVCSLPGSVHGILQARIVEWVAISSSRESS